MLIHAMPGTRDTAGLCMPGRTAFAIVNMLKIGLRELDSAGKKERVAAIDEKNLMNFFVDGPHIVYNFIIIINITLY